MIDFDSLHADEIEEEKDVLIQNIAKNYNFKEAKLLSKGEKINEQTPLFQKYWLGRLSFELAERCNEVIEVKNRTINNYDPKYYALGDIGINQALTISLHDYGFLAMPEHNVLETEHTTYPKTLTVGNDTININTWFKVEHLLDIMDGAARTKMSMNDKTYKKFNRVSDSLKKYPSIYLKLISLH